MVRSALVRLCAAVTLATGAAGATLPAVMAAGPSTTTAATAPAPQHRVYTVHRGDSLWLIARRNHTTVANLVRLNAATHRSIVKNPRIIFRGWVLTVS